ncbi:MAG: hypothetical protein J6A59_01790 [Lachnospiraceae bacterium]|nr:hypothetical protein [Lachnospiraceae bacterium]
MAKEKNIISAAEYLFKQFGNEVNTFESIKDTLIETMRSEKLSLSDAVGLVKFELQAQDFTEFSFV